VRLTPGQRIELSAYWFAGREHEIPFEQLGPRGPSLDRVVRAGQLTGYPFFMRKWAFSPPVSTVASRDLEELRAADGTRTRGLLHGKQLRGFAGLCGCSRLPLLIAGFGDSGQLGVCGCFLTLC
jgi:hypothetical protein